MFPAVLHVSLFMLGSSSERLQFAQDLVEAFKEDSFVKLQNHGISSSVIKDLLAWVRS
jgi:isopenicillin N synthase-like dioxygenase